MKIGIIQYINSIPLGHGLELDAEVVFDHPAGLAERFARGELDAAFIPVFAWFEMLNQAPLVPGLSISSFGETRSVLIISQVPPAQIRTLALYPESRTSNHLTQILLRERHGVQVKIVPPGTAADARVVIGDEALAADRSGHVLDLGSEWFALTGLPLVYAICVARTAELAAQASSLLQARRDRNLADLEKILAERGLSRHLEYLCSNLDYHLELPHLAALTRMAAIAIDKGGTTPAR
jgi:chorismate dehydratase